MKCNFLFQSDCQVHLHPQIIPPNMEEYMSSLLTAVLPSVLNKFRIYLSLLRLLDYSISDEVTKVWTLPNMFSVMDLDRKHLIKQLLYFPCQQFFFKFYKIQTRSTFTS